MGACERAPELTASPPCARARRTGRSAQARAAGVPNNPVNHRPKRGSLLKHTILTSLLIALGCATGIAQTNPANAAQSQPATAIVQQVRIAPGNLSGRVLDGATRRPMAGHELTLLDASGAKVGNLTTSAEGNYSTPALKKGHYALQVRKDLTLRLAVDENATIRTLDIVVPQGPVAGKQPSPQDPANVPAAPGGAGAKVPPPAPVAAPGLGLGTWALIAAGGTAVAAPIVASGSGGSSERPVSPAGEDQPR
ncbi:MAG: carboxypeptidase regulatory-like domain-containing protein [Planctomycetes bacterium]|nr:carboxypeptidase regulatory-like domain-containing protein [Planctomycetota bacterium]